MRLVDYSTPSSRLLIHSQPFLYCIPQVIDNDVLRAFFAVLTLRFQLPKHIGQDVLRQEIQN